MISTTDQASPFGFDHAGDGERVGCHFLQIELLFFAEEVKWLIIHINSFYRIRTIYF